MGFLDAIHGSGWHTERQAAALRLCEEMRASLRCDSFKADPDRIYNNLDSDRLLPDVPPPDEPASRRRLLEELLGAGPPLGEELKEAISGFCHKHKKEGPEDNVARNRVLGRACPLDKLNTFFVKGTERDWRDSAPLEDIIRQGDLEPQRERLRDVHLAEKLMWSFYDHADAMNPFRSFSGERAELVDRLGMGNEESPEVRLVKWGHRLPAGVVPTTPTAWDGGVNRPCWYPGGRTRPLSADGERPRRSGEENGLPEVVHDPVTGWDLAIRVTLVAG